MTDPTKLKTIITDPTGADVLVAEARALGQALAKPLTSSQIRSIYSEVLQIKADWLTGHSEDRKVRARRAFILLKPKMAYRAKKERARGAGVEQLVAVLDPAVDLVNGNDENFRRFVEFFEAILAYHKAYGGS